MNALEPGSTLGGYRILARLRAGAMGVLYLGRRIGPADFSRPVAIKVIHDHLAQNSRFCRMFMDEAKLSARIDHPNVVRVEEFGKADGRYYLAMELVNGVSLAQVIGVLQGAGRISIEQAVAIAIEIAGGLHGAHEATDEAGAPLGIVHRDVSPHNVLVSYTGSVRVIDFGIAKARQVGGQTKTGSLRGKLAYMPPEQARSARTVDRRADLYGVGLILWEMLTFRRVFNADTEMALFGQIQNPVILPPSALAPSVPRVLDEVILRTLSQDPSSRPQTGLELQRALLNALPAAGRVLSSDLGVLMAQVRAMAASRAEAKDDASALYVEEVRRTLTIFGRQMNESIEADSDAVDTRPSQVGGPPRSAEDERALASVIVERDEPLLADDDTTRQRQVAAPAPFRAQHLSATHVIPMRLSAAPVVPGRSAVSDSQRRLLAFVVLLTAIAVLGMGVALWRFEERRLEPASGESPAQADGGERRGLRAR